MTPNATRAEAALGNFVIENREAAVSSVAAAIGAAVTERLRTLAETADTLGGDLEEASDFNAGYRRAREDLRDLIRAEIGEDVA